MYMKYIASFISTSKLNTLISALSVNEGAKFNEKFLIKCQNRSFHNYSQLTNTTRVHWKLNQLGYFPKTQHLMGWFRFVATERRFYVVKAS